MNTLKYVESTEPATIKFYQVWNNQTQRGLVRGDRTDTGWTWTALEFGSDEHQYGIMRGTYETLYEAQGSIS